LQRSCCSLLPRPRATGAAPGRSFAVVHENAGVELDLVRGGVERALPQHLDLVAGLQGASLATESEEHRGNPQLTRRLEDDGALHAETNRDLGSLAGKDHEFAIVLSGSAGPVSGVLLAQLLCSQGRGRRARDVGDDAAEEHTAIRTVPL